MASPIQGKAGKKSGKESSISSSRPGSSVSGLEPGPNLAYGPLYTSFHSIYFFVFLAYFTFESMKRCFESLRTKFRGV